MTRHLITSLCLLGFSSTAWAASKEYTVAVETASNSGAGTDNYVTITVRGTKGSFSERLNNMDNEGGQNETWTGSREDVGKITSITLALSNSVPFGDDWTPRRVFISVDGSGKSPNGWAEFNSLREIDSGSSATFNASANFAPVLVVLDGAKEVKMETVTKCQVGDNTRGSIAQDRMRHTESWEQLEGVSLSKTEATELSLSTTLSYESPATRIGSFSASVTAGVKDTVSTTEERVKQTKIASAFDWTMTVAPHTALIRCVDFEVPWGYQLLKADSVSVVMKSLDGPITPTPGFLTEVPQRDPFGNTVPVLASDITSRMGKFTQSQRQQLEGMLGQWRADGYVVDTAEQIEAAKITSLAPAIEQGKDVAEIRRMIDAGMPVAQDDLVAAISTAHFNRDIAVLLMDRGAKPDRAMLKTAVDRRDDALVRAMIDRGAPSDANLLGEVIRGGDTAMARLLVPATPANHDALALAVDLGDAALFQQFTGRGARLSNNNPVHVALDKHRLELAKLALSAGGDANDAVKYSMGRNDMDGIHVGLDAGASPEAAYPYAIERRDPRLFRELVTKYRGDANVALARSIEANALDFGRIALVDGRASADAPLPGLAKVGNMPWLRLLVEQGGNPTPGAMPAIEGGKTDALAFLITSGAQCGDAAHLNRAIEANSLPMTQLLVQKAGAPAESGRVRAIALNQVNTVRFLLDEGASATGLAVPAAAGHGAMVQLLVERGADVNEGARPAVQANHTDIALFLLDHEARIEGLIPIASGHGNAAVVARLLERGADPEKGIAEAVASRKEAVAEMLIDAGADVTGHEYVAKAVEVDGARMVMLLHKNGGDVSYVDARGQTFLHQAAGAAGRRDLTATLIELGVEVDLKDAEAETALHKAVQVGKDNLAVVEVLIASGADVNSVNAKGRRVLKDAKGAKVKRLLKDAGAKRK